MAIGLGLAAVLGRWIEPLQYGESARDPATYGAVAGLMAGLEPRAS